MKSDCFKTELNLISDTKIRAFIKEYLDKFVPDYFYVLRTLFIRKFEMTFVKLS